jgi:exopolysaccharide biosynthesis polyprenyl glycosylphosphotransferase
VSTLPKSESELGRPPLVREVPTPEALPSGAPARLRKVARLVAVTDMYLGTTAMLAAYLIRFSGQPIRLEFALVMAVAPFVWLGVFSAFGLYGLRRLAPAEEFRRIVWAVAVGTTLVALISFWSKSSFSRIWVALTWFLATVFVLVGRKIWHVVMGRMRADGRLAYRTIVVGANGEVARLVQVMKTPDSGFRVVGCLSTAAGEAKVQDFPEDLRLSVLGDVGNIRDAIRETGADSIFIAASSVTPEETADVAKVARQQGVELRMSSSLPLVVSTRLTLQPVGDVMALSLRPVQLSGRQAALKRIFDLIVSGALLLLLMPLLIAIAAAIKITSRGPILFRQRRVGRQGEYFMMLKFRTMVTGAESLLQDLAGRNEASGLLFKIRDDPRITRVGKWLRRWSLDEVPQLINVMRGEMSLVGPRPLPIDVSDYEEWQLARLEVPPGVTGLWQVSGRSDLSFDEFVRLDLFYIENWSITYDLFVLAKTIPALLSKKGAY